MQAALKSRVLRCTSTSSSFTASTSAFAAAGIADVDHQGLPVMRTVDDVIHPAREEAAAVQKRIPLLHRLAVVVPRRRGGAGGAAWAM